MYLSIPALIGLMWFVSRSERDRAETFEAVGMLIKPIAVIALWISGMAALILTGLVLMAWSQERVNTPWTNPNAKVVSVVGIQQVDRLTNDTITITVEQMNSMKDTVDFQRYDFHAITK